MADFEHFGIECKNHAVGVHIFRISPPRLTGEGGASPDAAAQVRLENILCPTCKSVFSYGPNDVRRRLFRVPDEYLLRTPPLCFVVEFRCSTENCRLPLLVHVMAYGHENKLKVL